jgi:hypothetical protein
MTYSNHNIDLKDLKKKNQGLKSNFWKRGSQSNERPVYKSAKFFDPRIFGYPMHFISEDYHFTEMKNGERSGI